MTTIAGTLIPARISAALIVSCSESISMIIDILTLFLFTSFGDRINS